MTYPGHPIVIMVEILQEYPDLKEAYITPQLGLFPNALTNPRIHGSGTNVSEAITLLEYVHEGALTIEQAFAMADTYWAECDNQKAGQLARWQEGQNEADQLKETLRHGTSPSHAQ
jgi:hypothetical protein